MEQQVELSEFAPQIQKMAIVIEKNLGVFSELLYELGYEFGEFVHKKQTANSLPLSQALYEKKDRKVNITILYHDGNKKLVSRLVISIVRIPYSTVSDFLSLSVFLEKNRIKTNPDEWDAVSYDGEYDEQIRFLFIKSTNFFRAYLLQILKGEEWRTDCSPNW